jgi:hypothetical protein
MQNLGQIKRRRIIFVVHFQTVVYVLPFFEFHSKICLFRPISANLLNNPALLRSTICPYTISYSTLFSVYSEPEIRHKLYCIYYCNINIFLLPASLAYLTHCGRVTKISVFNTVKLGTSASSS